MTSSADLDPATSHEVYGVGGSRVALVVGRRRPGSSVASRIRPTPTRLETTVSNNAVGVAVVLPAILMLGLLLIVIAWKILDIARERARAELSVQQPALIEFRRVVGADLAEIRRRLDALEERHQTATHAEHQRPERPSAT